MRQLFAKKIDREGIRTKYSYKMATLAQAFIQRLAGVQVALLAQQLIVSCILYHWGCNSGKLSDSLHAA